MRSLAAAAFLLVAGATGAAEADAEIPVRLEIVGTIRARTQYGREDWSAWTELTKPYQSQRFHFSGIPRLLSVQVEYRDKGSWRQICAIANTPPRNATFTVSGNSSGVICRMT